MSDINNQQERVSVRFYYAINFTNTDNKGISSGTLTTTELAEINEKAEQFFAASGFETDSDPELKLKTTAKPLVDLAAEPLILSKVAFFTEDDLDYYSETHGSFAPTASALQQVHSMMRDTVQEFENANSLRANLNFLGATSRNFVFETYYEGSFELHKIFSEEELNAYFSVSEALEDFFDNVASELDSHGIEVTKMPSTSRRAKGGIYRFEFYFSEQELLKEHQVEVVDAIFVTANSALIHQPGFVKPTIDFPSQPNLDLKLVIEELLGGDSELIDFNVNHVDCDDDPLEVENIFLVTGKRLTRLSKQYPEIKLVKAPKALATVEVDINSIPVEIGGYTPLFEKQLSVYAAEHSDVRATLYVCQLPSINFGYQTWSVFIGVAGDDNLLDVIESIFRSIPGVKVRCSDYIDPSSATKDFHIQDGYLWRPDEGVSWVASLPEISPEELYSLVEKEPDEEEADEDSDEELDVDDFQSADAFEENDYEDIETHQRLAQPTRYRAARKDAKVGSIKKRIEAIFGLPEGSVSLCGPDKRPLRSDATIGTLRRRWE